MPPRPPSTILDHRPPGGPDTWHRTPPSATSSTASSSTPSRGRPTRSSTPARARATPAPRCRAPRTSTGRTPPPTGAFETWGQTTPQERSLALLKIADAIDARADEITRVECRDTGKPIGLTASEELPPSSDHFRFFAGAARVLEGKSAGEYLADHTSFVRREPIGVDRPGHAVELPADDDDLEDRPGPGRRQHRRPQAQRHHAGVLHAAGRDLPGVPAARAC